MNRCIVFWSRLPALGLGLLLSIGCDYSAPESLDSSLGAAGANSRLYRRYLDRRAPADKSRSAPREQEQRTAILESSITLIQRAALQPGGNNFKLAVQKLNQYFEGTPLSAYLLEPAAREYLARSGATANSQGDRESELDSARHSSP